MENLRNRTNVKLTNKKILLKMYIETKLYVAKRNLKII